ncbi:hypothetical protein POM88_041754 [Heracleum sosnowskyi]|uniref:Uncharacterized protein n=1 Tax=Heracleum sosnowskyi TaxID=360622 RepID=A0AAD8HH90_9APIA|nr:hypothetical protein POM88_041754 [Heracleum sosnowskyi]
MSCDVDGARGSRPIAGNSASGGHDRGDRSRDADGASGSRPIGGKSANGGYGRGSKNVDVGGASGSRPRVGVGNIGANSSYIGGGRGGQAYEHHLTDDIYDASSEDFDYDDDSFDDEFDNDLGGSNDKGNGGSEQEGDGNIKNEGDGRSDDEDYDDEAEGGNRVDYDDEVQVEVEGDEDDEEVTAQHNRMSYSLGLFGTPPSDPYLIRMIGRVIDLPIACRTLLALMRVHWPAGCVRTMDVDRRFPRWWSRIRKMFFNLNASSNMLENLCIRFVIEHISDQLVMQAVDRIVAFARAHPDQFDLAPKQVNMLA